MSRPIYNPIACWQLFEATVATLCGAVGRAGLPSVPRHPDDVYGDSPSAACSGPRDDSVPQRRAAAQPGSPGPAATAAI
jgi:hypothetical protein